MIMEVKACRAPRQSGHLQDKRLYFDGLWLCGWREGGRDDVELNGNKLEVRMRSVGLK